MDRRTFLAGCVSLLATPFAAEAQTGKAPRVGYLSSGFASQTAPTGHLAYLVKEFREGMGELGYVEGQNVAIEYRFAEGRVDRLPDLAAELVGLRVDVIVVIGPVALNAAKRATRTTPLVAVDYESDPVAAGFVASFGRPGGNISGIFLDQADLSGKWLQLLKEAVPRLSRVAVLWDSATPSHQLDAIKLAAPALTVTLQALEVRGLTDFEGAFTAAAKNRAQAVVFLSSPLVFRNGTRLANLAVARRLPTISLFRESATAGCLMAYGPSLAWGYRRVGAFAGGILKGVSPSDMPVERPARFELVINLKTAKALGLTIPPSLLARADHVIE